MPNIRAFAVIAAAAASVTNASPARAYPVDCAILLCLAGGWPASTECAQAYTVFIARITPWPVEPPLQIWNCPMQAAAPRQTSIEKLFDIAHRPATSSRISSPPGQMPSPALIADQADIDISDPAYDFVRSIQVYQTEFRQRRNSDGDCNRWSSVRLGTYGVQGDYAWSISSTEKLPEASEFSVPQNCNDYYFRSVFVDWRDFEGTYGFEEVRY